MGLASTSLFAFPRVSISSGPFRIRRGPCTPRHAADAGLYHNLPSLALLWWLLRSIWPFVWSASRLGTTLQSLINKNTPTTV